MLRTGVLTGFMFLSGSLAATASTWLIQNQLSPQMAGRYLAIMAAIRLVFPIALLGRSNAIVRSLSSLSLDEYDWFSSLTNFLRPNALAVAGLSIAVSTFLKLPVGTLALITISSLSLVLVDVFTSVLRSQRFYSAAVLLNKSGYICILCFYLVYAWLRQITLVSAYVIYAAVLAAMAVVVIPICKRLIRSGQTHAHLKIEGEQPFLILNLVNVFFTTADSLIIARYLSEESLATYGAVLIMMRIYQLVLASTGYLLMPELARVRPSLNRIVKVALLLSGMTAVIGLGYILFGKPLLHLLYNGKYDQGAFLIMPLIGVGSIQGLYVLPSSLIGGVMKHEILQLFAFGMLIAVPIQLGVLFMSVKTYGLMGAAMAMIFAWLVRFLWASFATWRGYRSFRIQTQ